MEIKGSFQKFIDRDANTGLSTFTFKTIDGFSIKCKGNCTYYATGIPLKIEGNINQEEKIFYVRHIEEYGADITLTKKYFMSALFGKISSSLAARLAILTDGDLFGFMDNPDALNKMKLATNKSEEWCQKIIKTVKETTTQRKLLDKIADAGCTIADMSAIYKRYGEKSLEIIQNNPYRFLSIKGISFKKCDYIAQKENRPYNSTERRQALLKNAMQSVYKSGSTRVSFNKLYNKIKYAMKNSAYPNELIGAIDFLEDIIFNKQYVIYQGYIYEKWQYNQENAVANDIKRLMKNDNPIIINTDDISEIEKELHVTYDNSQKEIFKAGSLGFCILTGPPGSGKTSTILGFIMGMKKKNPKIKIQLAATTGCASMKLSDSTEIESETIQRMLKPDETGKYLYNKYNQLDCDLLIIDEYSMADIDTTCKLFCAIKTSTIVIIVGDCDQLKSVGCGNVLGDMINSGIVPVIRLNTIHRQAEASNSLISDNATKVNAGITPLYSDYRTCGIYEMETEEKAEEMMKIIYQQVIKKEDINSYSFMSLMKKGILGTDALNIYIHNELFGDKPGFRFGNNIFCINERVMMLSNNYELKYFNGEMGRVISYDALGIEVQLDHGEVVYLDNDLLYDVVPAYVKTVHKAQGGESEIIVLLVSNSTPIMLNREILYTGMTRAKKMQIVISVGHALSSCITNEFYRTRNTGLCDMLQSA